MKAASPMTPRRSAQAVGRGRLVPDVAAGRRTRWLVLFILLPLFASSGCTHLRGWLHNGFKVGPDYRRPAAPVAERWIDFNDPRVIADPAHDRDWWRVFDDPALNQLVQSTYEGNLPLRVQAQRVLEFRARRAIAVGNLLPGNGDNGNGGWFTLQPQVLSGFYRHIQLSEAGNPAGVDNPTRAFDLWNFGGRMQWELDVWGKYRRRIEDVNAQVDREVELYDDLLAVSLADTASAYVNLRASQELIALARRNVEIQQGSLRLAQARFEAGAVSELDVTQARSTLRETEALIPRFQTDARQANNLMCVLLGLPPRDLTAELGEGRIPTAPSSVALGIPGELLRRRPDIRAAEREVASQSAQIGFAVSDLFPHFSIDGSFSWTASELPDLFTGRAFGGMIGPSFSWKILNYGRVTNNIRVEESQFQQAALQYQQTVLNANKEVEDALVAFLQAQERARRLREAVEATSRSVDLAVTQYREGAVDFERIFNLQNVLVRQQIDLTRARAEISLSLIQIYRALRGGWQIRLAGSPTATRLPPALLEEVTVPERGNSPDAGNRTETPDEALPPLPEDTSARPRQRQPRPVPRNSVSAVPANSSAEIFGTLQAESHTPVTAGTWRKKS